MVADAGGGPARRGRAARRDANSARGWRGLGKRPGLGRAVRGRGGRRSGTNALRGRTRRAPDESAPRKGLFRRHRTGRFQPEAEGAGPVKVVEEAEQQTDEAPRSAAGIAATSVDRQLAAEAERLAPEPAGEVGDEELEAPEWLSEDAVAEDDAAAQAQEQDEAEQDGPEPEEPDAEDKVPVSLSEADYNQLRALGMSVTQAKRVMRYRREHEGFKTLDELDRVPGFTRNFLDQVKTRLIP